MAFMNENSLLSIRNLSVAFPTEEGDARAIYHLSLDIRPGEVLGLVGESGCGKSMTALAVLGLIPTPGFIEGGEVFFEGKDLRKLSSEDLRKVRGAKIALIPQDPLTSLNPVYTVGEQIREVIELHQGLNRADAQRRAIELLEMVRIPNAGERVNDYPHQFSGGMRQRVMIAMALSCQPTLLIADEPTTALDVTVQAQILDLLNTIRREQGTAILLITHDLGVVAEMCERVAVMYAGRIVEEAPVHALFREPKHPYAWGLLKSLPTMEKRDGQPPEQTETPAADTSAEAGAPQPATRERRRLQPIEGQPPAITAIPPGCAFAPRCDRRMDVCVTAFPLPAAEGANSVCCYLYPGSFHPQLEAAAIS